MLQIKELTITHKKDLRVILEKFQLVLNDGDKAVIIGEEGNGKSTLMKWIYNPQLVDEYTDCEGLLISGRERLAYLPQELPDMDRCKTLYEFFTENEKFYDITPRELTEYARSFKISPDFFYSEQKMESLSGGEKIKAQLIRILIQEPTVLLLDEPSNDIDIETLELLEKIINDWKHIVLYISHDETLIENTATMIIHIEQLMRKQKSRYTVAHMGYRQYVEERLHKYQKQEQQAVNERIQQKARQEKYARIYQSVEHDQSAISRGDPHAARNLKDKMHTVKAMGKRFERESENMTEMPEQEEAIFFKLGGTDSVMPRGKKVIEYELPKLMTPDGLRLLAENIYLQIRGPEKVCIIGNNGNGKTTLIKKIASELLGRTDIRTMYMPQNYEELLELDKNPVDYLDNSGDKKERTKIRTYLGSLKYTPDEMSHPIRGLSGGQKAKVLLLKMSLSDADVLILDEPTRNFSSLSGPVIRKMIKEFPGAVISISHDRKYIDEVCTVVYELTSDGLKKSFIDGKQ